MVNTNGVVPKKTENKTPGRNLFTFLVAAPGVFLFDTKLNMKDSAVLNFELGLGSWNTKKDIVIPDQATNAVQKSWSYVEPIATKTVNWVNDNVLSKCSSKKAEKSQ